MTRHVLAVDLKDDPAVIEKYREHHRRVWPEVLRSLRSAGIVEMEIYLLGRRLVMIVDAPDGLDVQRYLASHAASDPRVGEWEALMKSLQEGEWWGQMERVFHLPAADTARVQSESARRA
jgi:L-rhamnose mutarotase